MQYTIIHYEENGRDIFQNWLDNLKDLQARTAIARKVKRIENGNFWEHRFCRDMFGSLLLIHGQAIVFTTR